jgi:DNA helicase II / ATP-dependent DNA helicase PcrA
MPDLHHRNITEPASEDRLPGTYSIDYERVLNPAQLSAVTHGQGPLLVIAGAGSGKTRTLTYRVARLVENGVAPQSILLLSFTRKAAQEMLKRAADLLDHRCREVAGGTFHSFAYHMLRKYSATLGFQKGLTILDRADSEDLIGMIRKETTPGDDVTLPRKSTLAAMFSRAINKNQPLEDIIYNDYPHFCSQIQLINEIWMKYSQRKVEHAFCDYDDLLVYLHRMLREEASVRLKLSAMFNYILVDEYQDTNHIQAEIISLLANPQRNVMVVGDDSQSIYAFRGANFKNIITFPERFPGTRIIKLEENYRSVQPILDMTNQIIEQAAEKYSKRLFTRRRGGRMPMVVATSDEHAQSRYICSEITRLIRQGILLDDIAVLFRASFHSFDLELELTRRKMPFVKYGGFKFAESSHIKDMLAHMKIMAVPNDRLSWQRVLLLLDKVGPKSAQRVYEQVAKQGQGAEGLLKAPLPVKLNAALDGLKELITTLTTPMLTVQRIGEMILQYYSPLLKDRHDDYPRRLRDLEQLISIMARYDNTIDFLADMALEPPNTSYGDRLAAVSDHSGRLTLSTVHSAKGLEWHTVFVIWTLDGRFPSHMTINNPDELEEERRLMYVAATRARENLIFTYPAQVYDRISNSVLFKPSRFLDEIPSELMDSQFYNPNHH